jgi:hypothetical protein
MRWTANRLLFVLYCVEVGVFLLIAPWSPSWDRAVIHLPLPVLHSVYLHPLFRGAVTGFGFVHIVWGAHDLESWLAGRQRDEQKAS